MIGPSLWQFLVADARVAFLGEAIHSDERAECVNLLLEEPELQGREVEGQTSSLLLGEFRETCHYVVFQPVGQRLKKRKLALKDQILLLESQLIPDLNA